MRGFRPGELIAASTVAVLGKSGDGNARDIGFVHRRAGVGGQHRDSATGADLLRPFEGVAHELLGLQDRPAQAAGHHGVLDAGRRPAAEHRRPPDAVALGEGDDLCPVGQVVVAVAPEGDEVNGVHSLEGGFERAGVAEVSRDRLDPLGRSALAGFAGEGADLVARFVELATRCRPTLPVAPVTRMRMIVGPSVRWSRTPCL